MNPGMLDWYTPDADHFAADQQFGTPNYSVGIGGGGWSVVFQVWDQGEARILEMERSQGIDSGPAKKLVERVKNRMGS